MSNEFELPTEGIKIYSPQKGWIEQPQTIEAEDTDPPHGLDEALPTDHLQRSEPVQAPEAPPAPPEAPVRAVQAVHRDQAAALAEVGGSLHALFEALQQPFVSTNVIEVGPSWRDVADLSRFMEERLAQREDLLDRLRGLEDEIRKARGGMLEALALLAAQEQRNLEAAQVRADVSAMAAQVLARRFSENDQLSPPKQA